MEVERSWSQCAPKSSINIESMKSNQGVSPSVSLNNMATVCWEGREEGDYVPLGVE